MGDVRSGNCGMYEEWDGRRCTNQDGLQEVIANVQSGMTDRKTKRAITCKWTAASEDVERFKTDRRLGGHIEDSASSKS